MAVTTSMARRMESTETGNGEGSSFSRGPLTIQPMLRYRRVIALLTVIPVLLVGLGR